MTNGQPDSILELSDDEQDSIRADQADVDEANEVLALLVQDIAAGVRVLKTRDGVDVSEDQIMDRARNIAAFLVHNDYFDGALRARPEYKAPDFATTVIR